MLIQHSTKISVDASGDRLGVRARLHRVADRVRGGGHRGQGVRRPSPLRDLGQRTRGEWAILRPFAAESDTTGDNEETRQGAIQFLLQGIAYLFSCFGLPVCQV